LKTSIAIGPNRDAAAQTPEKSYRELALSGFARSTFLVAAAWFCVDLPFVGMRMEPGFIRTGALSGLP